MLSIDAGRLAPMTYHFQQQQPQYSQLSRNMAGNSFSSRGKAESIRKISIPSLPTISTSSYDDENQPSISPFPTHRGSGRSQLLAGLRTAPKTPTSSDTGDVGFFGANGDFQSQSHWSRSIPSNTSSLKNQRSIMYSNSHPMTNSQPNYPRSSPSELPQEVYHNFNPGNYGGLPTPPASSVYVGQGEQDYEAKVYADLLARNISLAQQQQVLQQQMRIVQQAQQFQQAHNQMQQLQIQSPVTSLGTPPISPAVYSPTVSGIQPNYGFYSQNQASGLINYHPQQYSSPHAPVQTATFAEQTMNVTSQPLFSPSPPPPKSMSRSPPLRSSPSPPREVSRPDIPRPEKTPSPPGNLPSGFRRGHKKCSSLSSCINASAASTVTDGGPKTSVPKLTNVPSTPVNSTFGGRGDHPIRQPRGPPSLEEIIAKPNAKHEGSKNFSSRQRRRALTKLVNAGIERRGAKPLPGMVSMTSVSENDIVLCFRDADSGNSSREGSGNNTPVSVIEEDTPIMRDNILKRGSLGIPRLISNSAEKRRSALF